MKKPLITLLLLSVLIRLPAINQSLWLDEAIQAWSTTFSINELLFGYINGDFNPPLLHLIHQFLTIFVEPTEFIMRLPSLLSGVGVTWLTWRFLSKFINDKPTLILGTLLNTTAPLLMFYSQEARMYMPATFFAMWSMVSFWEITTVKTNKTQKQISIIFSKPYLEYFCATGAMMLTHYMTWFLLPTQFLFAILVPHTQKELQLTRYAVLQNLFQSLKLFLPLLFWLILISPILLSQLQVGSSAATDLPVWQSLSSFSLKQLALIPTKILIGRIPIDLNLQTTLLIATPLTLWLGTILLALKKSLQHSNTNYKQHVQSLLFLILWLTIPIIIAIIVSTKLSIFSYFRFLYITPAFYLLLIIAIAKLTSSHKILSMKYWVLGTYLAINIITSSLYLFNPSNHREDWKGLVNYLNQTDRSPYVIILSSVDRPFWYYDQNDHIMIDYPQAKSYTDQPGIWLIKYAQPIFEPDNKTENDLLNNYGYTVAQEKHFRGDIVVKYLLKDGFLQAKN